MSIEANIYGSRNERKIINPEDITSTYLRDIGRAALLTTDDEVELAKRIEAGSYAEQLILAAKDEGHPQWKESMMLSDIEHSFLPQIQAEGQGAKVQMIEANTALVVYWAKKYDARGLSLLDVIQEGNLGLIHAVDKFDYKRGYKFSTYASRWIRKYITQGVASQSRTIQVPQEISEQYNKYLRVKRELAQELGGDPDVEDIAERLSMEPEEVIELEIGNRSLLSLEKNIENRGAGAESEWTLGDMITETETSVRVENTVSYSAFLNELDGLFAEFSDMEKQVVRMYFGFDTGESISRGKIGEQFGITREAVRQIEIRLMKRLRQQGWDKRLEVFKDLFDE